MVREQAEMGEDTASGGPERLQDNAPPPGEVTGRGCVVFGLSVVLGKAIYFFSDTKERSHIALKPFITPFTSLDANWKLSSQTHGMAGACAVTL